MVRNLRMEIIFCLMLIPLYYIVGDKNIYLYVLSLALYKVFSACFRSVTINDTLKKYSNYYMKYKIFKLTSLIICVVSLIFLLLGIMISDIIGNLLKINNSFVTFLLMGVSIGCEPITKISLEYIDNLNYKKLNKCLYYVYNYLEIGLLLIIAGIVFRNNIGEDVANGCLYLSKIISALIVNVIIYLGIIRKKRLQNVKSENNIKENYKQEVKKIFNQNNLERFVMVVKEVYYYFSIVILYLMLEKRYGYMLSDVTLIISFLYLYVLSFINILGEIIIKKNDNKNGVLNKIYWIFDNFLSLSIIIGIIAPLLCKVIFNNTDISIYLIMGSFLGIFITLYKITFEELCNKRLGYISLILGILVKIILMVPLVDSFYRMGYNLVYGDIISTIIGMGLSIVINYIYFKNHEQEEKYFEKLLKSMYENIFLCILLVVMQFIIPVKTDSYFKALLLIFVYGYVSILFIKFRRKKRV